MAELGTSQPSPDRSDNTRGGPGDHRDNAAPSAPHDGVGGAPECTVEADTQGSFDARFDLFMAGFREACEKEGAVTAVAIVIDPKISQGPLVYSCGHKYDVAHLLARALRKFKTDFVKELDA